MKLPLVINHISISYWSHNYYLKYFVNFNYVLFLLSQFSHRGTTHVPVQRESTTTGLLQNSSTASVKYPPTPPKEYLDKDTVRIII